jgi:hypothetical protein
MLTEDRAARLVAEALAGASLVDAARAAGVSARAGSPRRARAIPGSSADERVIRVAIAAAAKLGAPQRH